MQDLTAVKEAVGRMWDLLPDEIKDEYKKKAKAKNAKGKGKEIGGNG
jgi:hypothetical protein